jgi:hypothetical protein
MRGVVRDVPNLQLWADYIPAYYHPTIQPLLDKYGVVLRYAQQSIYSPTIRDKLTRSKTMVEERMKQLETEKDTVHLYKTPSCQIVALYAALMERMLKEENVPVSLSWRPFPSLQMFDVDAMVIDTPVPQPKEEKPVRMEPIAPQPTQPPPPMVQEKQAPSTVSLSALQSELTKMIKLPPRRIPLGLD